MINFDLMSTANVSKEDMEYNNAVETIGEAEECITNNLL